MLHRLSLLYANAAFRFSEDFNTSENREYIGPVPDKRYYMPKSMSVGGRNDFEKWHYEQVAKNVVFASPT